MANNSQEEVCICPEGEVMCRKCRGSGRYPRLTRNPCTGCLGTGVNLEILEIDPNCPVHGPSIGMSRPG